MLQAGVEMPPESPTLFLTAERAAKLSAWRSPEPDVVSLHLAVDAAGSYPSALSAVRREALSADPRLRMLAPDVDRIAEFVRGQFSPAGRRGLFVVSCLKQNLFEAFALPEIFKTTLTVADGANLKPLDALGKRYRRFLVLVADAGRARFVEIHLGESDELETIDGDMIGAGLSALAERTAALAALRRVDRLVIGASEPLLTALAAALPTPLQEALILEPLLGLDRPIEAVIDRVRHSERESLRLRESVLVRHFLDGIKAGTAVAGLERVATVLQEGRAMRLLVREGWAKMGRSCASCRHLSLDHRSCPWCFRVTEAVFDVVAELVDRAIQAGVEVVPISQHPEFEAVGRIGAELAAPAERRPEVPTARALRGRFALKDGRASPLRPRDS